jgi:hypothetical protein
MNKIKGQEVEEIKEAPAPAPIESATDEPQAKSGVFRNWLDSFSAKESAAQILPFAFFLAMVGMFYIANKHMAEKNIRNIEKINRELKELKWEYMTAKSELMFRSKQTEVAKMTETFGLKEALVPPQKIVVKKK